MRELGNRLKLARETLGVSIEELADATQIEVDYLMAMERGEFDLLPGPVYVRSYLRTYAIYVDLDPRKITRLYQQKLQAVQEPLSRTTRIQREMALQQTQVSSASNNQKKDFSSSSEKMVTMSRATVKNPSNSKKRKKGKPKKSSGFAKFYNSLLIIGFLLLLVAAGVVFYLRFTTTKVAELSDKVIPLTVAKTNGMLGSDL